MNDLGAILIDGYKKHLEAAGYLVFPKDQVRVLEMTADVPSVDPAQLNQIAPQVAAKLGVVMLQSGAIIASAAAKPQSIMPNVNGIGFILKLNAAVVMPQLQQQNNPTPGEQKNVEESAGRDQGATDSDQ